MDLNDLIRRDKDLLYGSLPQFGLGSGGEKRILLYYLPVDPSHSLYIEEQELIIDYIEEALNTIDYIEEALNTFDDLELPVV